MYMLLQPKASSLIDRDERINFHKLKFTIHSVSVFINKYISIFITVVPKDLLYLMCEYYIFGFTTMY